MCANDCLPGKTTQDFWDIEASGEWADDNRHGREFADQFLKLLTPERPFLLGRTVQSMIEKGRWSGVECGFWQHVAERLISDSATPI